jgi:signal transduction histidine kinase
VSGKRRLRGVLARQWIAFTLLLFAGFAAMALLGLFVLEDSFIDQRLRGVAADLPASGLPERFALHPAASAPEPLRARMRGAPPGAIREFRLDDGRYLHVLATRSRDGHAVLLAYDVTDQLRVNAALRGAWPWLLLMAAVLALCAWALASAFATRVSRQAGALLARVADTPDPARLRELADATPIHEFSELARLQAQAWEARLAVLEAERETLAFLGHELRTPLQSARTSLALLQDDPANTGAWSRLQRAVDRLARASNGVLWFASDTATAPDDGCAVRPLVDALAAELAPMAAARGQDIVVRGQARWPLPGEVAETVLANLLLNAIQHGGAGRIDIAIDERGLELANPVAGHATGGFGIGLQVVQRLLGRFGWTIRRDDGATRVSVVVGAQTMPVA